MKKLMQSVIEEKMNQGFNRNQAISLAWAEYFEEKAAQLEYRFQGNYSPNWTFDCYCHDCKQGGQFKAADTVRLFIINHKNHKTVTRKLR